MGYIVGLGIVLLLFVVLHNFTQLQKTQKFLITFVLVCFIGFAYLYNTIGAKNQEKLQEVVLAYKQGKTLTCESENKKVNAANYSLSVGTYTFIGRKNTPYNGVMVSATKCSVATNKSLH